MAEEGGGKEWRRVDIFVLEKEKRKGKLAKREKEEESEKGGKKTFCFGGGGERRAGSNWLKRSGKESWGGEGGESSLRHDSRKSGVRTGRKIGKDVLALVWIIKKRKGEGARARRR